MNRLPASISFGSTTYSIVEECHGPGFSPMASNVTLRLKEFTRADVNVISKELCQLAEEVSDEHLIGKTLSHRSLASSEAFSWRWSRSAVHIPQASSTDCENVPSDWWCSRFTWSPISRMLFITRQHVAHS